MRGCRRILIVDGDPLLCRALAEQLEQKGEFAVLACGDAAAALAAIRREVFDAVLLDVGLPETDGREAWRPLRRSGVNAPILLVTGGKTECDGLTSAETGATDCI